MGKDKSESRGQRMSARLAGWLVGYEQVEDPLLNREARGLACLSFRTRLMAGGRRHGGGMNELNVLLAR